MSEIAVPPLASRPRTVIDWRLVAFLVTAIVLGLAAGLLVLLGHRFEAPVEIVLVLVAAAVFMAVFGARVGVLALLVAACMISRFTYSLGPVDVRSEQIAALLGAGVVVYNVATRRSGVRVFRPNLAEILLGAWFLLGLISSLTAAPEVSRSVKGLALLVVSALGFALPRRLLDSERAGDQMDTVVKIFLLAIAVEGAYGAAAWLAYAFGVNVALSPNPATGHLSSYGTLWEPNVFGAFCAAGAIAWSWLGPRYFRLAWLGLAACLAGTFVSFTRAAWAAVVVVLALSLLGRVRERAYLRHVVLGILAVGIFALVAFGAERATDYYVVVPDTNGVPHQPTRGFFSLLVNEIDVLGRLDQLKIGGDDIKSHLVLGNGTASYGERHLNQGQPEHIANLELTALYDTGIVGLAVFIAFGLAIAYAAWKVRHKPLVAGLGMATLVIVLTNVATETTELMITWLMAGLLLMAVDAAGRERVP